MTRKLILSTAVAALVSLSTAPAMANGINIEQWGWWNSTGGAQVGTVFLHCDNEGVVRGNHLLEAGVRSQLGHLVAQVSGDQGEQAQYDEAIPENQLLQEALLLLRGVVTDYAFDLGHYPTPGYVMR